MKQVIRNGEFIGYEDDKGNMIYTLSVMDSSVIGSAYDVFIDSLGLKGEKYILFDGGEEVNLAYTSRDGITRVLENLFSDRYGSNVHDCLNILISVCKEKVKLPIMSVAYDINWSGGSFYLWHDGKKDSVDLMFY